MFVFDQNGQHTFPMSVGFTQPLGKQIFFELLVEDVLSIFFASKLSSTHDVSDWAKPLGTW